MKQLKMLEFDGKATIVSRFHEVYKNMWQTNGDQVSRIYAGTGALEGKSKVMLVSLAPMTAHKCVHFVFT